MDSQWSNFIRGRFLKNKYPTSSYFQSSIWPGIKKFYPTVLENGVWNLENGKLIQFWTDRWLSSPIIDLINVQAPNQQTLEATVADFILDGCWSIPSVLTSNFPALVQEIKQTIIPKFNSVYQLLWQHTGSGNLSYKDAYRFLSLNRQPLNW